jgi:hypothetical protein
MELAFIVPGIGRDISLPFDLVDQLLAANRYSPLLEMDREAAT